MSDYWHNAGYRQGVSDTKEEYDEKVEHLNDLIFELGENLKCAQDQNHYFKLMCEYRDKLHEQEKMTEEFKTYLLEIRGIHARLNDCKPFHGDLDYIFSHGKALLDRYSSKDKV